MWQVWLLGTSWFLQVSKSIHIGMQKNEDPVSWIFLYHNLICLKISRFIFLSLPWILRLKCKVDQKYLLLPFQFSLPWSNMEINCWCSFLCNIAYHIVWVPKHCWKIEEAFLCELGQLGHLIFWRNNLS